MGPLFACLPPKTQLILIGIGSAIYALGYLAILIAILSKYPPLMAKQPLILLAAYAPSTIWFVGTLQTAPVVENTGIFGICQFWYMFAMFSLGLSLYILFFNVRLLRLYFIMVLVRSPQCWEFYGTLFVSYLPTIIVVLWTFVQPGLLSSRPVLNSFQHVSCILKSDALQFAMYACIIFALLFMAYLNYKLSSIKQGFYEYKDITWAILLCFVVFVYYVIIYFFRLHGTDWARIGLVVGQIVAGNSMVWCSLHVPLYGYLFDTKDYLENWYADLQSDSK
ncbi:hypothetical protein EDD86DRAFT_259805 [Gorgonomyces haynaldii]|nr:hypothetical protein EDD86DRAFT_259805 [Gorgonomyces haynaldii]